MPEEGATAVADPGSAPAPEAAAVTAPAEPSQIAGGDIPKPDTGFVMGDGTLAEGWVNRLPEELAPARDKLGHYRNVTELAKALHNANQTIGKKGVIIPGQNASAEEIAAYDRALGVPEKSEDYAKLKPEKIPEGVNWPADIEKVYFDWARQNHVPAETMRGLMGLHAKQLELQQASYYKTIEEHVERGRASLRQVWRDDYNDNIAIAQRAAAKYGVDPRHDGFTPEITRMIVAMAKDMREDKLVSGTTTPISMHDMLAQAKDIQTNPMNPDYKRYRDGDPEVRAKVRRYNELGTPKNSV